MSASVQPSYRARKEATLNIIRDERHARLHGRVRGAGRANRQTYAGDLGQCRDFQPDALGLTEATAEIVKTGVQIQGHPETR